MEPRPMEETEMESLDPHEDRHDAEADPEAESADDVSDVNDVSDASDASDVSHDANDDDSDDAGEPGHDVSEDGAGNDETAYPGGGRDVPTAPTTGDAVVDAAMIELAAAEPGSLTERIEAGERAHRVLQGRLSDLGGA